MSTWELADSCCMSVILGTHIQFISELCETMRPDDNHDLLSFPSRDWFALEWSLTLWSVYLTFFVCSKQSFSLRSYTIVLQAARHSALISQVCLFDCMFVFFGYSFRCAICLYGVYGERHYNCMIRWPDSMVISPVLNRQYRLFIHSFIRAQEHVWVVFLGIISPWSGMWNAFQTISVGSFWWLWLFYDPVKAMKNTSIYDELTPMLLHPWREYCSLWDCKIILNWVGNRFCGRKMPSKYENHTWSRDSASESNMVRNLSVGDWIIISAMEGAVHQWEILLWLKKCSSEQQIALQTSA